MTLMTRLKFRTVAMTLCLLPLLGLSSCINDAPYKDGAAYLSLIIAGQGEVTFTDFGRSNTCTPVAGECNRIYEPLDAHIVTFEVKPYDGYSFEGWSGDLTGNALNASVIMSESRTVTATFIGE